MTTTTTAKVSFRRMPTLNDCWCGCGGQTKSRFVPGHDAKFHSDAKKVARGLLSEDDLPALPHEEAAAEFERCVALERPVWAAKEAAKAAEKAAKAAAKEAEKAAKAAAKEAEKVATEQATS